MAGCYGNSSEDRYFSDMLRRWQGQEGGDPLEPSTSPFRCLSEWQKELERKAFGVKGGKNRIKHDERKHTTNH